MSSHRKTQKEVERMKKEARINARIPCTLKELMQRFIALDTHINESDLIRDAIRTKIKHDAPELFAQLFQQKEAETKCAALSFSRKF